MGFDIMGIFLTITSDMKFARDYENQIRQSKVEWDISKNIGDINWQESISHQVQKIDIHHISLSIVLRLFRREEIEKNNLKSRTKFQQAKQCLNIDIMLDMDKYLDLPEHAVRNLMADDIYDYTEEMLIKYKNSLHNLDAEIFATLLKKKIEEIKDKDCDETFYKTQTYESLIIAKEFSANNSD